MLQRQVARAANSKAVLNSFTRALQPRIAVRSQSTAPATIVDRGFWRSLIPKPLRKENRKLRPKSKDWNPATFFIVIFLLIGSMSIQMITLRNSFQRYVRQSDIKIGLLREVVGRIQKGEKFDVEKALGTGNPEKEEGWEEVLRAIETADGAPKSKKPRRSNSEPEPEQQKSSKEVEQQQSSSPETPHSAGKPSSGFGNFF